MGVEKNERVDEAVMEAAENAGSWKCPELFSSLAYVGHTILERKWKEANNWFRMENDMHPPLQRA